MTERQSLFSLQCTVSISCFCNRSNFRTPKNFVLKRSRPFVRYKFSYSEGRVTYTHGFRMLLNFVLLGKCFYRKYEIYEIKSRTKISAITVAIYLAVSMSCEGGGGV